MSVHGELTLNPRDLKFLGRTKNPPKPPKNRYHKHSRSHVTKIWETDTTDPNRTQKDTIWIK